MGAVAALLGGRCCRGGRAVGPPRRTAARHRRATLQQRDVRLRLRSAVGEGSCSVAYAAGPLPPATPGRRDVISPAGPSMVCQQGPRVGGSTGPSGPNGGDREPPTRRHSSRSSGFDDAIQTLLGLNAGEAIAFRPARRRGPARRAHHAYVPRAEAIVGVRRGGVDRRRIGVRRRCAQAGWDSCRACCRRRSRSPSAGSSTAGRRRRRDSSPLWRGLARAACRLLFQYLGGAAAQWGARYSLASVLFSGVVALAGLDGVQQHAWSPGA